MKLSPKLKHIQDNMKPGVISAEGFLGSDSRDLSQILDSDNNTVKTLKLSHEIIAEKMIEFKSSGEKGLGEFISIPPHFEVRVISVRGGIRSPFEDAGLIKKTSIIVKNTKLNKEITYTDLCIHLVGKYGFYQGIGSTYRLNPEDLVEVLEIKQ